MLLLKFFLLYFYGCLFLLLLLPLGTTSSTPLVMLLLRLGRLGGLLSLWSLLLLTATLLVVLASICAFLLAMLSAVSVGLSCRHISSMHLPHEVVHKLGWVLLLVLVALSAPSWTTTSCRGLSFSVCLIESILVTIKRLILVDRCR